MVFELCCVILMTFSSLRKFTYLEQLLPLVFPEVVSPSSPVISSGCIPGSSEFDGLEQMENAR